MCPFGVDPKTTCPDGREIPDHAVLKGCKNEECTLGKGACTCTGECDAPQCGAPDQASCDPYNGRDEICGDSEDNNCDGNVDEACGPREPPPPVAQRKRPDCFGESAGTDPIRLASRSAVTDPFTDFSVDTGVAVLGIAREYSSNDASYSGMAFGPFGRGWHHGWEGAITCDGDGVCTVSFGVGGLQFQQAGSAPSLDGSETWQVFRARSDDTQVKVVNRNLLVRRPTGRWILFLTDGREYEFESVCDTCTTAASDPFCRDPLSGGKARLVAYVDANGRKVDLRYDRPGGVLLAISDALGHSLEVRGGACSGNALATELRYDGTTVASYSFQGTDLVQASDADGSVLRSYVYDGYTERLTEVRNEAGHTVVGFAYNADGTASGVIDQGASVSVNYASAGSVEVTEFYNGTSATSVRTFDRNGNIVSVSDDCACGAARTFSWLDGELACVADVGGHVTWRTLDALGRVTDEVRAPSTQGCAARPNPGPELLETWFDYGVEKPVAQGFSLPLEHVVVVSRNSNTMLAVKYAAETYSYDPGPQAIDPPGYTCQASPLPVGSVVCRYIEGGYAYDLAGTRIFEKHATFYSYDARGRLVRTIGPVVIGQSATDVTPIEERSYWPDSESLVRRGRLSEVRRFISSSGGWLAAQYDYDAFGVFQITAPDGGLTTIVRDGRGRPVAVLTAAGAHTRSYYDGLEPRLDLLPSGAAVRWNHDETMHRLSGVERLSSDPDAPGAPPVLAWGEYYAYDAAGNRVHTERRDAAGNVTWSQDHEYDVQHRLVSSANPEDPTKRRSLVFDPSGFLSSITDEEARRTAFTPDGLARVRKVTRSGTDASGNPISLDVAQYSYRGYADALASVTDARTTSYEYDDFGRVASVGSASLKAGTVRYTFDARANVLRKKDAFTTTDYTYDGLDRLLSVSATNSYTSMSVAYTHSYDEAPYAGRLTSVTDSGRTLRYTYDAAGRLATESLWESGVSVPLTVGYSYDSDGRLWRVSYPSGLQVEFVRDAAGEMTAVRNVPDGTAYATGIVSYPGGPIRTATLGNGLSVNQTFDRRYQPQVIQSGPLSLSYTMSPAGDVRRIQDSSSTISGCQRNTFREFKHDFQDRLTESPGWLTYGYDNNGNRTSEVIEGASTTYAYDTSDRVVQAQRPGSPNPVGKYWFGYDMGGNLSVIAHYDSTGTGLVATGCLRHDPLNRLVLVGDTSYLDPWYCSQDSYIRSTIARFKYDFRGRRIARWLGSTSEWTYVISDPAGNPLSEIALTGDPANPWRRVRDYVWLDGRPLAQIEYPGPSGGMPGYVYYQHVDHLGMPRALTNSAGQLVWNTFPKPYGEIAEYTTVDPISQRTVVTNLRLPGQYDERLFSAAGINMQGPYYNWNRWYLPSMGRYLELDPIAVAGGFNGPWGPNWYGYAEGNPLRFVDRLGLYSCTYSISTHRMTCTPDQFPHSGFDSDHYTAGHNTPTCPDCRDNPARQCMSDMGPLPTGDYSIGALTTANGPRRNLAPARNNSMCSPPLAAPRFAMQTHGCGNPRTCSDGCIAATDIATRDLFDLLMNLESNNRLTVVP